VTWSDCSGRWCHLATGLFAIACLTVTTQGGARGPGCGPATALMTPLLFSGGISVRPLMKTAGYAKTFYNTNVR
jgi:hypothetical protein